MTTVPHAKWHIPLPRVARRVLSCDVLGSGMNMRIGQAVTTAVGTTGAFYFFAVFMAAWMLWQSESRIEFGLDRPRPVLKKIFFENPSRILGLR